MFIESLELGDAGGEGHNIELRLMDDGIVIIASYNPDTDSSQQVVLLPEQLRALMQILNPGSEPMPSPCQLSHSQ